MKKKLMAMMMCLTLTVGTFAGCAGGETKEAEDSKTEEMSDKDSEQEVSKDTITITDSRPCGPGGGSASRDQPNRSG